MRRIHVALAVITAGLFACASRDRVQPAVPQDVSAVRVTSGAMDGDLDDPQIATIAEELRDGLEERARLAVDHGSDGVRRYARRLLADDPGVSITLMNLAPRTSILGDELTSDTTGATETLAAAQGTAEFDRKFVESMRTSLSSAITMIDQRLFPEAENQHLRANLARMRSTLMDEHRALEELARTTPLPPSVTPTPTMR